MSERRTFVSLLREPHFAFLCAVVFIITVFICSLSTVEISENLAQVVVEEE